MPRQVRFEGRILSVPDDASDDEVAQLIEGSQPAQSGNAFAAAHSIPALPKPETATPAPAKAPAPYQRPGAPSVGDLARQFGKAALETPDAILSAASAAVGAPIESAVRLGARAVGANPDEVGAAVHPYVVRDPQTDTGRQVLEKAGEVMSIPGAIPDAAANVARNTGHPKLAEGVDKATDIAADVLAVAGGAKAVKGPKAAKPAAMPKQAPKPATPTEAVFQAGYKGRPSDVAANEPGRVNSLKKAGEAIGGSEQLGKGAIETNQTLTDKLAKRAVGIPEDTRVLTPKVFETAVSPHGKVYDKVAAKLGNNVAADADYSAAVQSATNPRGMSVDDARNARKLNKDYGDLAGQNAQGVIENIRKLRKDATADYRNGRDGLGDMRKALSNAMEDLLERRATAQGDAALVNEYKAARTALAKIYAVEDATVAGRVDASKLLRARQKGALLTDELATIADAAEFLPQVTKHPQSFQGSATTNLDTALNWASLGAKPLMQAGMRKVMESGPVQRGLAPPTGKESLAAPGPAEFPASMQPRTLGALAAPETQTTPRGNTAYASDLEAMGFTPDVIAAGAQHPGAERFTPPPPLLALPAPEGVQARPQGWSGATMLGDEAGGVGSQQARSDLGLTPDVAAAGARHPGAPGVRDLAAEVTAELDPVQQAAKRGVDVSPAGGGRFQISQAGRPEVGVVASDYASAENAVRGLGDEVPAPPAPRQAPDLAVSPSARQQGYFDVTKPGTAEVGATVKGKSEAQTLADDVMQEVRGAASTDEFPAIDRTVVHEVDDTGGHVFQTADSGIAARPQKNGNLRISYAYTKPSARGQRLSPTLLIAAFNEAQKTGGALESDFSVSAPQQKAYAYLKQQGYDVVQNPDVTLNPDTGDLVSNDPRLPVFRIVAGPTSE